MKVKQGMQAIQKQLQSCHGDVRFFKVGLEQLMTWDHLDEIAEEVNEITQNRQKVISLSQVLLNELANKYGMELPFFTNFVYERLGSIIQQAEIEGNKLVTKSYKQMLKGRVKGALLAVITPVLLE